MADAKKSASAQDKAVYCRIRKHLVLHVPIVTLNMKYELAIVDVCLSSLPTKCPRGGTKESVVRSIYGRRMTDDRLQISYQNRDWLV